MSVVGLFAGIGGFEAGFAQADYDPIMLVDNDRQARAVLKARFRGTELRGDVMKLKGLPSGTSIVTAGFPCQDLSMAGSKSGIHGTKSGVVERMLTLLSNGRVPTVVIENVYFMLHLNGGHAMRWLVEQLEDIGYRWAYRVLDTMGFGLPHRRRRVYLVASREVDPRRVLFADETPVPAERAPNVGADPLGFYWTEGRSGVGFTVDGIPPLKVGSAIGIPSAPAVLFPDGEVLMPSLEACERLQGFTEGWTDVFGRPREARCRWRLVGNAVSVPVAAWVAKRLKSPGTILDVQTEPLVGNHKWPRAACSIGSERVAVDVGDRPIELPTPSISSFRERSWTRLSERALSGFTSRAEEGNLHMPDGFLDAIRDAPRKSSS